MYIFAEPVTEEEIEAVQTSTKARVEAFENEVLGLKREIEDEHQENKENWEDIEAKVQEAMNKDESGVDELEQLIGPESLSVGSDVPDGHVDQGSEDADRARDNGMKRIEELHNTDDGESALEVGEAEAVSDTLTGTTTGVIDVGHESIQELSQTAQQEAVAPETMAGPESGMPPSSDISASELPDSALPDDVAHGPVAAAEPNAQSEDELVSSSASTLDTIEDSTSPSNATSSPLSSIGSALNIALMGSGSEEPPFTSHADADFLDDLDNEHTASLADASGKPLLAMTLTIRNKVNGRYVLRPGNLSRQDLLPSTVGTTPSKADTWSIEYSLGTVNDASRSWTLYRACQLRRKKRLGIVNREEEGGDNWKGNLYMVKLRELAKQGRRYRRALDKQDEESGRKKVVWGWEDSNGGTKVDPGKAVPHVQVRESEGERQAASKDQAKEESEGEGPVALKAQQEEEEEEDGEGPVTLEAQEEGKSEGEEEVKPKTQKGKPEGAKKKKLARNIRKQQKARWWLKQRNKKKATDE